MGLGVLCLALVALVYGRSLGFELVHDDRLLLTGARVADLSTLPQALGRDLFWLAGGEVRPSPYWRPVVVATYYFDHAWSGGAAWAGRLTNLVLLATLGVLVARRAGSWLAAVVAATLVIAHPMQVEAAVNITARTDLLAALFGTLAVFSSGPLGAGATALALGSKEVAVVIPLAAALRARLRGEGASAWVPHTLVTAGWLAARQLLVARWEVAAADGGGLSVDGLTHLGSRLSLYLGRLVLPLDPVAARALPEPSLLLDLSGVAALVIAALLVLRRGAGRGDSRLGLALVFLPLLPVSGLLSSDVRYAEGFLCWPLVGLALVAGAAPRRTRAPLLVVAVVGALSAARHVPTWSSEATLWEDAWARRPGDPVVGLKLARDRVARSRVGRVAADPWPPLHAALAAERDPRRQREAHALAAALLIDRGRTAEALFHLRVAADPADPEAGWALASRCVLEVAEGDADPSELRAICGAALESTQDDPDLWNGAGIEAARRGDLVTATERFERAVALEPGRAAFGDNLERARAAALDRSLDEGSAP